jgi:hypothetical protein
MVEDYEVDCIHTEKERMKMKPEICSAVFFIKNTVKSCVLPAVTEVTGK